MLFWPPVEKKSSKDEHRRRFEYYREHFPQFDPLSQRLFLAFIRASITLKLSLDRRMRSYGITSPAYGVLSLLETVPGRCLPMNDISRRTWVTAANVTGVVDTLQKKGFVLRRPHPRDRRVILVGLTPRGRQRLARILPRQFNFIRGLFAIFNERERNELLGFLERFREEAGK